jgi:hypothetical protein
MQAKTKDLIMFLMQQPIEKADTVWELKEYVEKKPRSLDSNAYFHVLVRKLAQAQSPPVSLARCKNMMIAAYGQPDEIDGQPVIIKSNLPPTKMYEQEYLHTGCIKVTVENGHEVFFYRVYRPSHTYNSKEMSKLIEGTVQECKDAGIETATPDELQRMAQLWAQAYEKNKG